jgi:hypothetical protein
MVLKVLGNWDYKPEACGNKNMVITFKRLSGAEEMALRRSSKEDTGYEMILLASIVEIKQPFILDIGGERRPMVKEDIPEIPELKDLFYELIVAHNGKTVLGEDEVKKPESPST